MSEADTPTPARRPRQLATNLLSRDMLICATCGKGLSPRDPDLVTVAALITAGNTDQLPGHLRRARENGLTEAELKEVIIHLAFYAGRPGPCPLSRSPSERSNLTPATRDRLPAPQQTPSLGL